MDLNEAINKALDGNAILFTGSGFSVGAVNKMGSGLPIGTKLRNLLAKECGIERTENELSAVADYYLTKSDKSADMLIDLLRQLYTLDNVSEEHKKIMKIKWKRVYTTNYDLIAEYAAKENNYYRTVTLSDKFDMNNIDNVCVHINGAISNLTKEKLKKDFKLTDRSYDAESLVGKPWFDFMERDFLSAGAIFVIGFSMRGDIDIRRIIARPQIKSKVIFISGPNTDVISKSILEKYAPVYTIGMKGLSAEIEKANKTYVPSALKSFEFSSFEYEYMSPLNTEVAKFEDLTSFYYMGIVNKRILQKDRTGEYKNIILREAVNIFMKDRMNYKVFLAVSNIGNGKSLLCELIRNELREADAHVFVLKRQTIEISNEIEYITKNYINKSVVVIIDDYYKYLDVLKSFYMFGNLDKITFLLTARTSKLPTNYRKLMNALHINENDIKPLYLNRLGTEEVERMAYILHSNNMFAGIKNINSLGQIENFINNECNASISDLVLKLFDSSYIKKELNVLYKNALDELYSLRELTIASLASEVFNLSVSTNEIVRLLNIDIVWLQINDNELMSELFDTGVNRIKVRSSIVARKILWDIIPIEDLIQVLNKLLKSANRLYKNNNFYKEFMKAIISHNNFRHWNENSDDVKKVKDFYDGLRFIEFFANNNPFYWEQFALICIELKDYPTAKQCLKNAFAEADKINNFTPFHIETIYAHYLIDKTGNYLCKKREERYIDMTALLDAMDRLFKYYSHPEDDHHYVFKLVNMAVDVFKNNISYCSKRDISVFLEKMVYAQKNLKNL